MPSPISRRSFLAIVPVLAAGPLALVSAPATSAPTSAPAGSAPLPPEFPSHEPARVQEMVGVSHGNVARVRELLAESPALAGAAWDWGYGDWETALGAASHVGNREIAGLLMAHGARPDLFTFAMLGQLAVVRACVEANPGIQKTTGPHGLTLLLHARNGGEAAKPVVTYLEALGDADPAATSLPLSEAEMNALAGSYGFDDGTGRTLLVTVKGGALFAKRLPDGAARTIYHVGGNEFHPAGSRAVRLRFDVREGRAVAVTIIDGKPVLNARRLEG